MEFSFSRAFFLFNDKSMVGRTLVEHFAMKRSDLSTLERHEQGAVSVYPPTNTRAFECSQA
jgi:hypothetical protein